jgi:hypothetical protein
MSEKRGSSEDAEDAALQGPRDRAKARLPESQSPAVQPHTHRHSVYRRCCPERPVQVARGVLSAWQAIASEAIQGDEWDAYVVLDTFSTTGTRDRLRGASPKATESP